jgi:hypothetical protein
MKKILILAALLYTPLSFADDIYLGEPGYGGTGCPAGTVSVTLSPDAQSLSLLFDEYQVVVGGSSGKTLDRKSCNIAIPVHVPQGYSVSIFKIDYRGYNYLPKNANSKFSVEYFFAGDKGPIFSKSFYGPLDKDYLITNSLKATSVVWSACGADVNLRTNTSMRIKTYNNKEAIASVDSQDVNAAIIYQLKWKKCF